MAVSCMYIIFFNYQKSSPFLSNALHIIKLKFQEIKNTVRVPSRMKLNQKPCFSQASLFQQMYGDFEIYVYFLASVWANIFNFLQNGERYREYPKIPRGGNYIFARRALTGMCGQDPKVGVFR